jgi:trans-aconitate methyltransferase
VNKDGTDKEFPKKYISTVYSKIIKSKVPKSICEIGLRTGASLALWEKAFPEAEILAVDNGDDLRLVFPPRNKGTSISIVNAYTSAFLELIQEKSFDLIIDDGPRNSSLGGTFREN